MTIVLDDILGYPIRDIAFEENNIEFSFSNKNNKKIVCFEAKGTKTEDLHAVQHRSKKEHSTPIKQTWDYMGSLGLEYGVCTNYKNFILITKEHGYSKEHNFDFITIKNDDDKLKEFIGIFSKEKIIESDFVKKLHTESQNVEREFTKEFYKLYHETRLMLKMSFEKNNIVTNNEAIYFTQLFLNRLIFILFVEDRGFISDSKLFTNRILNILELGQLTEHSKKIYDDIKELFVSFDKGSKILGVSEFNGGLFSGVLPDKIFFNDIVDSKFYDVVKQNSELLKSTKLSEKAENIIEKHNSLNPIIRNLLIMDSYDFNTEVNVTILGHIFEQSISDLEELKKTGISGRKKDGVYYTPEQITDYICRNTIIPYLSKTGTSDISKLLDEYENDIDVLEEKFRDIKILDPACGSGAFLIKAIDILLEINREIQNRKVYEYSDEQKQITSNFDEESEIRFIVENNIYGVDLNSESVEITQLSIFLKIASNQRKLIGLSERIQVGNSLISDKQVDTKAFVWDDRLPEILSQLIEDKGFDVIIGNPPWQIIKPDVDEFFSPIYDLKNTKQKFSKLSKIKKNDFVKECLKDELIKKNYNLYVEYYEKQMKYFNGNAYNYQSSLVNGKRKASDLNLYKLFIEKSYALLSKNGLCGMVVPSGIYSDLGSKGLREMLFENTEIKALYSFVNKKGIFEDVHRQFKFCLIVFENNKTTKKFNTSFYLEDKNKLNSLNDESFRFDLDFIKSSSPDSLSILECSNKQEYQIFEKLYKFPLLSDKSIHNFKAGREFDMTNDSGLFHTVNIGYPLYEGKMMNSFNHLFSEPRYWIDKKEGNEILQSKELNRMKMKKKNSKEILHPPPPANR